MTNISVMFFLGQLFRFIFGDFGKMLYNSSQLSRNCVTKCETLALKVRSQKLFACKHQTFALFNATIKELLSEKIPARGKQKHIDRYFPIFSSIYDLLVHKFCRKTDTNSPKYVRTYFGRDPKQSYIFKSFCKIC